MRNKAKGMGLLVTGLIMMIAGIVLMSLPWILPTFSVWVIFTYLGYILGGVGGILLIVGIVLYVLRK